MEFSVLIPARYASSRLPGKPLSDIHGKPLIQHVYECGLRSGATDVVVATDDERIESVVRGFGGEVCMTASSHRTGTDRLNEVAVKRGYSDAHIIVNLQGDEPMMPAAVITQVARNLDVHTDAAMSTVATPIVDAEDLLDPHVVKIARDQAGYALYFSRAPIPWRQSAPNSGAPQAGLHWRHIGLYAMRAGFLQQFVNWPATELEQLESLEQLRVLWHGRRIYVDEAVEVPGHGVDTPQDLERVRTQMAALAGGSPA